MHDEPDESMLEKRTTTKSCEWLVRPACAASEFAATLTENFDMLKNEDAPFFRPKKLESFFSKFEEFIPSLQRLNKFSTETDEKPCENDVNNLLKLVLDDDECINETIKQFFRIGGAMFLTSIHFMVAQHIMSNPKNYSVRLSPENDPRCNDFKSKGDLKSMKHMFLSTCVENSERTTPTTSTTRQTLYNELQKLLGEDEDIETEKPSLPTKKTKSPDKRKMNQEDQPSTSNAIKTKRKKNKQ